MSGNTPSITTGQIKHCRRVARGDGSLPGELALGNKVNIRRCLHVPLQVLDTTAILRLAEPPGVSLYLQSHASGNLTCHPGGGARATCS